MPYFQAGINTYAASTSLEIDKIFLIVKFESIKSDLGDSEAYFLDIISNGVVAHDDALDLKIAAHPSYNFVATTKITKDGHHGQATQTD